MKPITFLQLSTLGLILTISSCSSNKKSDIQQDFTAEELEKISVDLPASHIDESTEKSVIQSMQTYANKNVIYYANDKQIESLDDIDGETIEKLIVKGDTIFITY